jgi:hypothetical protein
VVSKYQHFFYLYQSGLAPGRTANLGAGSSNPSERAGLPAVKTIMTGDASIMALLSSRLCKNRQLVSIIMLFLCLSACTTTTSVSRKPGQQPQGFLEKMMNQVTERECNVGRFICPYGLGPAGEPCECTDPSGVVVNGRTVK